MGAEKIPATGDTVGVTKHDEDAVTPLFVQRSGTNSWLG